MNDFIGYLKRATSVILLAMGLVGAASAQTTYTWNVSGSGAWTTSSNWTPTRTSPSGSDIILIDGSITAAPTLTGIPNQAIRQLFLINGANATLQAAGTSSLNLQGGGGVDFIVPSGSTLNLSGGAALSISLAPGSTAGSIAGTVNVSGGAHRILFAHTDALRITAGGIVAANAGFTGNLFGTSDFNSVLFEDGSTYVSAAGGSPFGVDGSNTVVTFDPVSLYKHLQMASPQFSGRTYGNFQLDAAGAVITSFGAGAMAMRSLTVTAGALHVRIPTISISGDISVAGGATLDFDPSSAQAISLNGSASQTISNSGTLTFNSNANVNVSNPMGVSIQTPLAWSGTVGVAPAALLTISSPVTIGGSATVDGTLQLNGGAIALTGSQSLTVNGTLTLASGLVTTTAMNQVVIASGGTLSGGSAASYVNGRLQRFIAATGTPSSYLFAIGDGSTYTPVVLGFSSVTVAGDVMVLTTAGDHPSIAWSGLNASATVNRYWSITGSVSSPSSSATFNFTPSDVDNGANAADFVVKSFADGYWILEEPGTRTTTSTETALSRFGDFQVGESMPPQFCGASAGGAWPACGAPVAVGPGVQASPSVAPDGTGGAFVAYQQGSSNIGSDEDVYLNRIDANGNTQSGWPSNGIPVCDLADDQKRPTIVADGSGGALIAWHDTRNDSVGGFVASDIYLQRITASGSVAPGWSVNGVAVHTSTPFSEEDQGVVGDGTGGAILLWKNDLSEFRLTRVTSSGTVHPSWPADGLLVGASDESSRSQLIADGAGGAYACWGHNELFLVRITSLGTIAPGWATDGSLVTAGASFHPLKLTLQEDRNSVDLVTAGASSPFKLTLQEDRNSVDVAWITFGIELRALRVTQAGSIASGWPPGGVVLRSSNFNSLSDLTVANGGSSGDAVFIWREDLPDPAGFQVYAQRLTPVGTIAAGWPSLGWEVIPGDGAALQAYPDCDGGTTLSFRTPFPPSGLRAIRFTSTATVAPGWPSTGVNLCSGPYSTVIPHASCPDGTGGVITAHARTTGSGSSAVERLDVYAQCVRADGTVNQGFAGGTPAGSGVELQLGPATVTFDSVTAAGETQLGLPSSAPAPPWNVRIVPAQPPVYYDVTTTALFDGSVEICIAYDLSGGLSGPEGALELLHYDTAVQPPAWVNVTTSIDTVGDVICGSTFSLSPFIVVEMDPTDVSDVLPSAYRLFANVPNPFNPMTTIRYDLPKGEHVRLEVHDVGGRLVRTLVNRRVEAGRHEVVWRGLGADGRRVASGIYFYRLQAASFVTTRRMVLLK